MQTKKKKNPIPKFCDLKQQVSVCPGFFCTRNWGGAQLDHVPSSKKAPSNSPECSLCLALL